MDYSFIIRRAIPEDAEAIRLILQEAFRKYMDDTGLSGSMEALNESVDVIKKHIEQDYVFIALIDGNPAGTVRVQILKDGTGYISRFGVRTQYQNIGIGKALMNLVDKLLKSKGVKKACLHTASKYRALMRFYYGNGFYVESTSTERGYIRALMVKEYE